MRRTLNLSLTVSLLLITAQRLPAPIQEVPESPSPTPAVAPAAEPRKPLFKPKSITGTQSSGDAPLPKGPSIWWSTRIPTPEKYLHTFGILRPPPRPGPRAFIGWRWIRTVLLRLSPS